MKTNKHIKKKKQTQPGVSSDTGSVSWQFLKGVGQRRSPERTSGAREPRVALKIRKLA